MSSLPNDWAALARKLSLPEDTPPELLLIAVDLLIHALSHDKAEVIHNSIMIALPYGMELGEMSRKWAEEKEELIADNQRLERDWVVKDTEKIMLRMANQRLEAELAVLRLERKG